MRSWTKTRWRPKTEGIGSDHLPGSRAATARAKALPKRAMSSRSVTKEARESRGNGSPRSAARSGGTDSRRSSSDQLRCILLKAQWVTLPGQVDLRDSHLRRLHEAIAVTLEVGRELRVVRRVSRAGMLERKTHLLDENAANHLILTVERETHRLPEKIPWVRLGFVGEKVIFSMRRQTPRAIRNPD